MVGHYIPNTRIAIDIWEELPERKIHFLSNFLGSQTVGLTSKWKRKIFTSVVNARFLKNVLQVKPRFLKALKLGRWYTNDNTGSPNSFKVALIPANHCPGSVMFLFKGSFGNILYTGHCRYRPTMLVDTPLTPFVANQDLDVMYLDNTYAAPECVFPTEMECIRQVVKIIKENPGRKIVLAVSEEDGPQALTSIAQILKVKIVVSKEKYRLAQKMLMGGKECLFTDNPLSSYIHAVDLAVVAAEREKDESSITILFMLAYQFESKHCSIARERDSYVVPYSVHSSYHELASFLSQLCPKQLFPIVSESLYAIIPQQLYNLRRAPANDANLIRNTKHLVPNRIRANTNLGECSNFGDHGAIKDEIVDDVEVHRNNLIKDMVAQKDCKGISECVGSDECMWLTCPGSATSMEHIPSVNGSLETPPQPSSLYTTARSSPFTVPECVPCAKQNEDSSDNPSDQVDFSDSDLPGKKHQLLQGLSEKFQDITSDVCVGQPEELGQTSFDDERAFLPSLHILPCSQHATPKGVRVNGSTDECSNVGGQHEKNAFRNEKIHKNNLMEAVEKDCKGRGISVESDECKWLTCPSNATSMEHTPLVNGSHESSPQPSSLYTTARSSPFAAPKCVPRAKQNEAGSNDPSDQIDFSVSDSPGKKLQQLLHGPPDFSVSDSPGKKLQQLLHGPPKKSRHMTYDVCIGQAEELEQTSSDNEVMFLPSLHLLPPRLRKKKGLELCSCAECTTKKTLKHLRFSRCLPSPKIVRESHYDGEQHSSLSVLNERSIVSTSVLKAVQTNAGEGGTNEANLTNKNIGTDCNSCMSVLQQVCADSTELGVNAAVGMETPPRRTTPNFSNDLVTLGAAVSLNSVCHSAHVARQDIVLPSTDAFNSALCAICENHCTKVTEIPEEASVIASASGKKGDQAPADTASDFADLEMELNDVPFQFQISLCLARNTSDDFSPKAQRHKNNSWATEYEVAVSEPVYSYDDIDSYIKSICGSTSSKLSNILKDSNSQQDYVLKMSVAESKNQSSRSSEALAAIPVPSVSEVVRSGCDINKTLSSNSNSNEVICSTVNILVPNSQSSKVDEYADKLESGNITDSQLLPVKRKLEGKTDGQDVCMCLRTGNKKKHCRENVHKTEGGNSNSKGSHIDCDCSSSVSFVQEDAVGSTVGSALCKANKRANSCKAFSKTKRVRKLLHKTWPSEVDNLSYSTLEASGAAKSSGDGHKWDRKKCSVRKAKCRQKKTPTLNLKQSHKSNVGLTCMTKACSTVNAKLAIVEDDDKISSESSTELSWRSERLRSKPKISYKFYNDCGVRLRSESPPFDELEDRNVLTSTEVPVHNSRHKNLHVIESSLSADELDTTTDTQHISNNIMLKHGAFKGFSANEIMASESETVSPPISEALQSTTNISEGKHKGGSDESSNSKAGCTEKETSEQVNLKPHKSKADFSSLIGACSTTNVRHAAAVAKYANVKGNNDSATESSLRSKRLPLKTKISHKSLKDARLQLQCKSFPFKELKGVSVLIKRIRTIDLVAKNMSLKESVRLAVDKLGTITDDQCMPENSKRHATSQYYGLNEIKSLVSSKLSPSVSEAVHSAAKPCGGEHEGYNDKCSILKASDKNRDMLIPVSLKECHESTADLACLPKTRPSVGKRFGVLEDVIEKGSKLLTRLSCRSERLRSKPRLFYDLNSNCGFKLQDKSFDSTKKKGRSSKFKDMNAQAASNESMNVTAKTPSPNMSTHNRGDSLHSVELNCVDKPCRLKKRVKHGLPHGCGVNYINTSKSDTVSSSLLDSHCSEAHEGGGVRPRRKCNDKNPLNIHKFPKSICNLAHPLKRRHRAKVRSAVLKDISQKKGNKSLDELSWKSERLRSKPKIFYKSYNDLGFRLQHRTVSHFKKQRSGKFKDKLPLHVMRTFITSNGSMNLGAQTTSLDVPVHNSGDNNLHISELGFAVDELYNFNNPYHRPDNVAKHETFIGNNVNETRLIESDISSPSMVETSCIAVKTGVLEASCSAVKTGVLEASSSAAKTGELRASCSASKTNVFEDFCSASKTNVFEDSCSASKTNVFEDSCSAPKTNVFEDSCSASKTNVFEDSCSASKTNVFEDFCSASKTNVFEDSCSASKTNVFEDSCSAPKTNVFEDSCSASKTNVFEDSCSESKTNVFEGSCSASKTNVFEDSCSESKTNVFEDSCSASKTNVFEDSCSASKTNVFEDSCSASKTNVFEDSCSASKTSVLEASYSAVKTIDSVHKGSSDEYTIPKERSKYKKISANSKERSKSTTDLDSLPKTHCATDRRLAVVEGASEKESSKSTTELRGQSERLRSKKKIFYRSYNDSGLQLHYKYYPFKKKARGGMLKAINVQTVSESINLSTQNISPTKMPMHNSGDKKLQIVGSELIKDKLNTSTNVQHTVKNRAEHGTFQDCDVKKLYNANTVPGNNVWKRSFDSYVGIQDFS